MMDTIKRWLYYGAERGADAPARGFEKEIL